MPLARSSPEIGPIVRCGISVGELLFAVKNYEIKDRIALPDRPKVMDRVTDGDDATPIFCWAVGNPARDGDLACEVEAFIRGIGIGCRYVGQPEYDVIDAARYLSLYNTWTISLFSDGKPHRGHVARLDCIRHYDAHAAHDRRGAIRCPVSEKCGDAAEQNKQADSKDHCRTAWLMKAQSFANASPRVAAPTKIATMVIDSHFTNLPPALTVR